GTRLQRDSEGIHFLLARIQDVFRFLDLQGLGFHRVKESWVWLVARHFRTPPIQGVPHGWCIGRYIRRLSKESSVRTQGVPRGTEDRSPPQLRLAADLECAAAVRGLTRAAQRTAGPPPLVCQPASDKRKTLIRKLSCRRKHASTDVVRRREGTYLHFDDV